ncbi:MAG: hypothetical protein ABIU58_07160 [Ramlibacter sp.]
MRTVIVSLFALLLPFAGPAQAQSVALGSDNATALKGARRVAIDQFGVEFITVLRAAGTGGGASAAVEAELRGVSDQAMQALADQAYKDTVAALVTAGFEVVPQEELQAWPEYRELAAKMGQPSPYVIDDTGSVSKIYAPTGMKAFFQSSGGRGSLNDRMTAFNGAYGAQASALAKTMNIHFVRFHFLAGFGTANASKGFLSNIAGRANASVDPGPTLFAQETQAQVVSQEGQRMFRTSSRGGVNGSIYLDKPYRIQAPGFDLVDTTTAESKQSDNVSNAISMGIGLLVGSRSARSTRHASAAVNLTDAQFSETYLRLISPVRDAMVERVQAEAR